MSRSSSPTVLYTLHLTIAPPLDPAISTSSRLSLLPKYTCVSPSSLNSHDTPLNYGIPSDIDEVKSQSSQSTTSPCTLSSMDFSPRAPYLGSYATSQNVRIFSLADIYAATSFSVVMDE
ncbi:hypothetical protein GOP47_0031069 [Adiantum capillus-veneris]|nr:hypothetical protein GOP47_0031069 [Adiantum capillus-veneris]